MDSSTAINKVGDMGSPCVTPLFTLPVLLLYIRLIVSVYSVFTPCFSSVFKCLCENFSLSYWHITAMRHLFYSSEFLFKDNSKL